MPAASQNSGANQSASLPLFRPEALAAQQQKFHGEIVLIRPFSLALLSWIAIGIAAVALGFLFLGQYTERIHASGTIFAASSAQNSLQAFIFISGHRINRIHTGDQVSLRCTDCSAPFSQWTGTVLGLPDAPLGEAERSKLPAQLSGPVYKIAVSLPPQTGQITQLNPLPQTGARVEADIPLGRKPLIKWIFERSGS
jgi:hypothetical protein